MCFTCFTKQVNLQPPVSTTLYPLSLLLLLGREEWRSWERGCCFDCFFYNTLRDEISETDYYRRALSKKITDQLKLFRASKGKITTIGTRINTVASIFVLQGSLSSNDSVPSMCGRSRIRLACLPIHKVWFLRNSLGDGTALNEPVRKTGDTGGTCRRKSALTSIHNFSFPSWIR